MLLENKVVVVTASTRGIGRAVVEACAHEGATVYMAARNEERSMEAIKEIGLNNIKFVYNDASQPESYSSMIETVVGNEGRIDVLVNNFGTSDPKTDLDIEHTKVEDFQKFVNINLNSVFIASQAAIAHMKNNENGGSIINISSVAGSQADLSQIAYGTSKAGINHMTKMIAVQEARNKIRCNVVSPGMTATDAVKDKLTDNFKDMFMKHTPIDRMGTPEEIAAAVVYFASDYAAYTTGQILEVTGGFGIASPLFGDFAEALTSR